MSAFLQVRDLHVQFPTEDGIVNAVDGVSFSLERGRTLAIVGESGSGKSVTAQAIMGLLNRQVARVSGEVLLDGADLVAMDDDEIRHLRGKQMAMVFQDPMSSLHPYYRVGEQLVEAVQVHQKVSKQQAREQSIDMLARVGIPAPQRRIDDFPHQLSGGMRQRVMIAMGLINDPELLIADEPTTALDATVQAQILELIARLSDELDTAVILITHDLGIVASVADDVAVMYGGRIVEQADVRTLYARPQMPYTLGLLGSVPRLDRTRTDRLESIPGSPPSLIALPSGCVFNPRCTYRDLVPDGRCRTERPELLEVEPAHRVRCHLPADERSAIAAEVLARIDAR